MRPQSIEYQRVVGEEKICKNCKYLAKKNPQRVNGLCKLYKYITHDRFEMIKEVF